MEFTKEQLMELGFTEPTPEQISALTDASANEIATLKKDWDGKANENAQNILGDIAKGMEQLTGIQRNHGERYEDFVKRSSSQHLAGQKSTLEQKQLELEKKIKSTPGSDALKEELENTRAKLDKLQQKEAQFKDWEENDYKGKLTELQESVKEKDQEIAFDSEKPSFPDTANEYEVKGKWKEFKDKTLKEYNIELNKDREAVAISKENKHLVVKLSELVKKDEDINGLLTGKTGFSSKQKEFTEVEGVPFKFNKDITAEERSQLIKDYLTNEKKLNVLSNEYAKEFAKLTKLMLKKT